MLTRSVTMGRPRAVYQENRTPELDGTLVVSLMEEASVNTEIYNTEVGGVMDALPKKHVAQQRKTWSTTECKELRKWRQEGQSFSKLSTYFGVSVSAVTQRYCKIIGDERNDLQKVELSYGESEPNPHSPTTPATKEGSMEKDCAPKIATITSKTSKSLAVHQDDQFDKSDANRMEPDSRQTINIDAPHNCPNEQHTRSPLPLEPRPEPMVIMSHTNSETTYDEPRKRRRLADGDDSQDEAEHWNRDANVALAVRVADLQAKNPNTTNDSEQLKHTNGALETEIAELKAQVVDNCSKLLEHTECHVAQLREIEKKYAKEVTELIAQHSAEVKELQDQNAKYKRVIAAWNA